MSMPLQTITYESGQMGMFFGSQADLQVYSEKNNNLKKHDLVMAIAKDFLISQPLLIPSTVAQRFKANVTAINVLKELRNRHSVATRLEQQKLATYCGWGAVSQVFDENNAKTLSKRSQVKSLLSETEYNSARTSTLSSFFTPCYLTKAIYSMLERAGFKSGNIIDPAAGVGGLINPMPESTYDNSQISLVELDSISAEVLEHLYPSAKIFNKGFEELNFKANHDLVIMNPPFGSAKTIDRNDPQLNGLTLHNYFLAKGIKLIRLGGLMVAIVSTSFLDSKTSKTREIVANLAELKGAIRLPKSVFFESAGANASVDVLLFQRSSSADASTALWVNSTEQTLPCGETYFLNDYFIANPSAILGDMEAQPGVQGKQVQCISTSNDLVGDIKEALKTNFPVDIYCEPVEIAGTNNNEYLTPIPGFVSNSAFIDIGGYAMTDDNHVCIRKNDNEQGSPVFDVCQEITGKRASRIASMVKIKQAMSELLELERTDGDLTRMEETRKALNEAYDAFVKSNGYIQETANRRAFGQDNFFPNLASLEVDFKAGVTKEQAKRLGIKAEKASATKADIFKKRIIKPWVAPTQADNVVDALWVCWNDRNTIDIDHIANLCGKSVAETKREIVGTAVFLNPETNKYEFAETYLSGDVKTKFEVVCSLLKGRTQDLKVNYNALEAIIPADISAADITVPMNAGWLPKEVVIEFISGLLECDVEAEHQLGQWFVSATGIPSALDTQKFGIPDYPASKIIARMMRGRDLIVRKTDPIKQVTYVDREATVQVEAVATEILARFDDWIWSCSTRRVQLEALYNSKFNRYVKPVYSGEMLEFPNLSTGFSLRKHQKTAVRRSLEQGCLLLDYFVGAGKSACIFSIVEKWHALGLKSRTAIVCPNHLVESFAVEWLSVYPLAKLLVLSPEDMSSKKRKETLNRIKTGSRIVIIPESTFKSIPLPLEAEQEIINDEIEETRKAINSLKENFSVKKLETKLKNLNYTLDKLSNRKSKDENLDFAELGFDSLVVDEAHANKNLRMGTVKLAGVKGLGNQDGSQRAWDMYCKIRFLTNKFEHAGVVFSTGTPVSNSIVEIHTMQKYLAYSELKKQNLHYLDVWADLYTSTTSEFEIDATGMNFKPVQRLRSFNNLPELQSMYACIAETVTREDLNEYLPKIDGKYNLIPPVVGGKPQTIFVEPSSEQKAFIDTLVERAKNLRSSPIENDNMLLIMYHARVASLDLRILDNTASANENSKAVACANKVVELYNKYDSVKGTQLIFCDLSVPNKGKERLRAKIQKLMNDAALGDELAQRELEKIGQDQIMACESNFSVYEDLKQLLISRGIKESEIAFAQDYKTPKAKAELYMQINNGVKRITIASTSTLGIGANVNSRSVGCHMLDPTYKPSCMQQRAGRVERQGNKLYEADPENFEGVNIIYYATRHSLDSFLFQTLQSKANWIEAFRSAKSTERTMSDLNGESLTFAEIKAEITGDSRILEHLQLTKSIGKLMVHQKRHQQQQHDYENAIPRYAETIKKHTQALESIKLDMATYKTNALPKGVFNAVVSGFSIDKFSNAATMLKRELVDFLHSAQSNGSAEGKICMTYCGFEIYFSKSWTSLYVNIAGNNKYSIKLSKGRETSDLSILYSVVNTLKDLKSEYNFEAQCLKTVQSNLNLAQGEIGKPFEHLELLIEQKRRLIEVKHELMEIENQENEQTQESAEIEKAA